MSGNCFLLLGFHRLVFDYTDASFDSILLARRLALGGNCLNYDLCDFLMDYDFF